MDQKDLKYITDALQDDGIMDTGVTYWCYLMVMSSIPRTCSEIIYFSSAGMNKKTQKSPMSAQNNGQM